MEPERQTPGQNKSIRCCFTQISISTFLSAPLLSLLHYSGRTVRKSTGNYKSEETKVGFFFFTPSLPAENFLFLIIILPNDVTLSRKHPKIEQQLLSYEIFSVTKYSPSTDEINTPPFTCENTHTPFPRHMLNQSLRWMCSYFWTRLFSAELRAVGNCTAAGVKTYLISGM